MNTSAAVVYEFGEFRLDPANQLLARRDGTPVPLPPRVFDTLVFMVEHHGAVLDKERLMEAVWPDSIVEENNLSQNISALRRVFGDTPGSHRYIVTVPGRDYRFAAEVAISAAESGEEPVPPIEPTIQPAAIGSVTLTAPPEPETRPTSRTVPRVLVAALMIVLLIGGILLLRGRPERPAPNTAPAASVPLKSIAVLPFESLSSDAENAYFAAAVQDEILSNLATIADLKVISRTSANLYKIGHPRNSREIGEQLGVAHLLEGNVQRVRDRLRVNAQLIDARNDAHLWAQTYDGDVADVFAIQSEIAKAIAGQLQAKLAPEEKARIEKKPTDNPEAYLFYLQAVERTRTAASKQDAVAADELYAQAIKLDPGFALADARASMLNSFMYQLGRDAERKVKARTLTEEALRLAPKLAEAHLAFGIYWYRAENNYSAALKEVSSAGSASTNDPEILEMTGAILRHQGNWREALTSFARAEELDPRHVHPYRALTQMQLRDWPAAVASYNHLLQIEPDLASAWIGRAHLEVYRNQNPAAGRALLEKLPDRIKTTFDVMETRWELALLDRDFAEAERLAPDFPPEEFPVHQPKNFYTGVVALARGDTPSARTLFEQVRPHYEAGVADHPESPRFHAAVGKLYAFLDRKDDAIRESRLAVELCPEGRDAVEGPLMLSNLALVYARTGEPDRAIALIEHLIATPAASGITFAELRLRWEWDPLRADLRFQRMLAGPEPKISN